MKTTIGPLVAPLIAACVLAGCGSESARHDPPGSPGNPVRAKPQAEAAAGSEGAAAAKPGYAKLVQRQTSKPASRFTPCNLVTKAEAGAILRTAVDQPVEAPMGPTCVYRAHNGRSFLTLVVRSEPFTHAVRQVTGPVRLRVAHRQAVCATVGSPALHVSVKGGRTLSVEGPCVLAQKFAEKAVGRLDR
ncbi:MAG TPA: hypothetical protein VGO71_04240 [Baekduia sp.]|nr:hypothetical protein [Baekduia sp.]